MSEIRILINENIVKRFRSQGLSCANLGSVLLILLGLYEEQYDLLDTLDDSNKEKHIMLLYQTLARKGFIDRVDGEAIYTLTDKGIEFVKFIYSFHEEKEERARGTGESLSELAISREHRSEFGGEQENSKENKETQEVSEWIEEWVKLFPSDKIEGRYLRTNKHECSDRMRWFMKEYSFDKDTIIKATKLYIASQEASADGHKFTRNSSYFIFKGKSKSDRLSDLATWCARVLEEGFEEKEYTQRDIV